MIGLMHTFNENYFLDGTCRNKKNIYDDDDEYDI